MSFKVISLTFLMVTATAQAYSSPAQKQFSYRVEIAGASHDCDLQGKNIANLLAQATGVTVTKVLCQGSNSIVDQGQTFNKNIIQVNYLSEKKLAPAHAEFSGSEASGTPLDGAGLFSKYSDCLQTLDDQSKIFEKETGTTFVAGYCQSSYDTTNPGYTLTLEGFGSAQRRLFLYSNNEAYPSDLIKSAIIGAGGHIPLADPTHIFYYNDQIIYVSIENLGTFSEPSQCENQRAEATSIYTKGRLANPVALCKNGDNLTVIAGGLNTVVEDFGGQSPRYLSFSDCMIDHDRMIQEAVSSQGLEVYGAICKPSRNINGEFAVTLYFKL